MFAWDEGLGGKVTDMEREQRKFGGAGNVLYLDCVNCYMDVNIYNNTLCCTYTMYAILGVKYVSIKLIFFNADPKVFLEFQNESETLSQRR